MSYCVGSAALLGLGPLDLFKIRSALAGPKPARVVWIQGSGCSGCSISFLNRISNEAPRDVRAVLTDTIDLVYHPTLMSASGSQAAGMVNRAFEEGNYILVVEGGVPTAFAGAPCWPWSDPDGTEVTFQSAVRSAAKRAEKVICVGTCACFGGVSAGGGGENPGGVKPVQDIIERDTINVAGCPPHPDAMVWAIAQCLAGNAIQLDVLGRPTALYGQNMHSICPRNGKERAGNYDKDNQCLQGLGCRGPTTNAPCPNWLWNNGANWCVDANSNCLGCTEPTFPGDYAFYVVP